jgi:hypothetical protein
MDIEKMDYYGNPVPSGKIAIGVDQGDPVKILNKKNSAGK